MVCICSCLMMNAARKKNDKCKASLSLKNYFSEGYLQRKEIKVIFCGKQFSCCLLLSFINTQLISSMQIMNHKSYNMYDFILKMDPAALEICKGLNNI